MADTRMGEIKLHRIAPGVGVLGALFLAFTLFPLMDAKNPEAIAGVMHSFHWAWVFWMGMTVSAFGLTLLHHTIRAQWSLPLLRIFEAAGGPWSLGLIGLLFIPIYMFRIHIFEWADPAHQDAIIKSKSWFLNDQMFLWLTVICFVAWWLLSLILRASSVKEDENLDPLESQFRTNLSAPALPLLFLSITVAYTAWMMSLSPHWFSTVYPILQLIGQALGVMALAVIIFLAYHRRLPYSNVIDKGLTRDHGNMLLTLTMLWAYLTLSQFLIIWSGNIREEVPYFEARSINGWNWVGTVLIVGQFFAVFLALCAPRTKHTPRLLLSVAIGILLLRVVDSYWTVMPSLHARADSIVPQPTDALAFIGIGGLWLAAFAYQLGKARIFPAHDPRIREALEHARS